MNWILRVPATVVGQRQADEHRQDGRPIHGIRNKNEYRGGVNRWAREVETDRIAEGSVGKDGLSPADVRCAIDPIQSFHLQLRELVESYQRLNAGRSLNLGIFRASANS